RVLRRTFAGEQLDRSAHDAREGTGLRALSLLLLYGCERGRLPGGNGVGPLALAGRRAVPCHAARRRAVHEDVVSSRRARARIAGACLAGHRLADRILDMPTIDETLTTLGVPFERVDHAPVFTCDEAYAAMPGHDSVQTKNIFLRDKRG